MALQMLEDVLAFERKMTVFARDAKRIQEPNGGTVNDWLREHQMRLQTAFDGATERIQAAARLRKERNDQHVTGGSLTEDPAEPVGPITSEYGEEQGEAEDVLGGQTSEPEFGFEDFWTLDHSDHLQLQEAERPASPPR
ncbi:hypothetical protein AAFF_G00372930 [Aldrovandia affinis]|uniref:Uncharacterized protein n=1 Tax=Aldrovandia affinis TaxID=143900 RepID=A0AAD7WMC8_9TELE|nr:hypothetical protein AAFF_G00372930 [Aldrovandia affinis]